MSYDTTQNGCAETSAAEFKTSDLEVTILCGDAFTELKKLPSSIVDVAVTSPPYFGQRDYNHPEQLGSESDPEQYISRLAAIFKECRRVMTPSSTLWLNLGDKYCDGQLLGMPWRVALALQKEGWLLRSDIIWFKPNAMPSSVKNRPTPDHEYLFMFANGADYYYDADAIREPHVTFSERSRMMGGRNHFGKRGSTPEAGKNGGNPNLHNARWDQAFHPNGRNKRTVWEIPLSKYPEAHFAVYPEKLVEPCILAGSCRGALTLDPFLGSGTTAIVASRLGRRFLGIDCNEEYCALARKRLRQETPTLF